MSSEVSQFLEQVERLRGQQADDDEVRAREREEFLAAKRERQARRQERARSISPQKSSPANTPSPRSSRRSVYPPESLKLESPGAARQTSAEPAAEPSPIPQDEDALADPSDTRRSGASTPPGPTSPLSWQRRPNSRTGSRPLSMVAAQNATQRSLAGSQEPAAASAAEQAVSKEQIARALGDKDPSWFRQTADRGVVGSAAYRRSQVEDPDRLDLTSVKAQLPGMTAEMPKGRPLSRAGLSTPAQAKLGSPVSLNPPRFDGPSLDQSPTEQAMTPPAGKMSPTRSTSPTKGLGGFVQSAMMKRSDSVKRWSVTSPPALTRADSVAANRNSYDRGSVQGSSRPQSTIRGGSTTPGSSRPTSRHEEKEAEQETARKPSSAGLTLDTDCVSKRHNDDAALPTSPSKTMDSRRWSPTKSSWLESALNRPESPKLPSKPTPSQPAWMVELNKSKAGRANNLGAETGLPPPASHKHEVSIGGLMRQSPMGEAARPNTTGLGGIYSPPPLANRSAKPSGSGAEKTLSREPVRPKEKPPADDGEIATPEKRPSVASPQQTKPKPEAPAKKDFRANLRQRPATQDSSKSNEPEFKNVFGNLRRTKTQNYVAPDVLKDNILRGKAALNVTDGPKRGERKDEFKEAILKKREDFKQAQAEGKGIIARGSTTASPRPVPEGLAKKAELGKPVNAAKNENAMEARPSDEPPKTGSPEPASWPETTSSQPAFTPISSNAAAHPGKSPEPEEPRRLSTDTEMAKAATESRAVPTLRQAAGPAAKLQQGRAGAGAGKLADRFNPALAGILARGPPPMTANGGQGSDDRGTRPSLGSDGAPEPTAPGPQLTHMTKNRARGPRRKAPTGSSAAPATSSSQPAESASPALAATSTSAAGSTPASTSTPVLAPTPPKPDRPKDPDEARPRSPPKPEEESQPPVFGRAKPAPLSIQQQVAAEAALRSKSAHSRPDQQSSESVRASKPTMASLPSKLPENDAEGTPQPGSPKKLIKKRMSMFLDDASTSNPEPGPQMEPVRLRHQRTGSRSPVKMSERPLPEPSPSPTKSDRDSLPSMRDTAPRSPRVGALAQSPSARPKSPSDVADAEATPCRPKSRGAVRPLSGLSGDGLKSLPALPSPMRSPTKQASEVSSLLTEFFGSPQPRKDVRVDTAEMLMNRPSTGAKISSLGFQMFQIFGDGKKTPVSAHNERVLFEQEMYVCAHNFTDAAGRKAFEVYFWVGDEVPEAMAEDAQLFVQREARSLGGKLVMLRQGKESAEFLQALGGVVIVRRGLSNKYDSLAPNMLCGRRYLGQVAFDEVDFAPWSLCAGFAYLITQSGSCYLWKGRGSDVAEVSCARLVGMDLTLTGELVEYEDGSEPASFWKMLGDGAAKPHSAEHWRLKPNYDKYCCRLFCSDADSELQVYEISPFGQADLSPSSIYIVDAFFEMYIVAGARAGSQYASFRIALDFAQEYAILAAGIEDRPFVPVSSVVLEGIPRDLKRVFRKWDDARSPTLSRPAAAAQGLRRGRSLRVVTLTQALQALSD